MSDTQVAKCNDQQSCATKSVQYVRPNYEVDQGDEAIDVRVYLPGVSKDALEIGVENDTLTIEAQKQTLAQDGWTPRHREIPTVAYRLQLKINLAVNANEIAAKSDNGILTVTLPVSEAAKPRKISVS
ncbi:MAG: Hsp20/alpha crystallin family protein [Verrucomicrobiota bacterium]